MSIKHLISSLNELYQKILNKNSESIEETNSMDFYLDELEKEAEANREKMRELGYWTEEG